ncbi:DUF4942 domain-containing protein [Cronobacter sakazakii]|uniref:DUF4942 domain-containing protein n=1 Tax=Cronobacter sakazakii TaxID=28141 RepID=UPI000A156033|nr:DUF4942 domain-containing protein [Cronobacter sakazakii]EMC4401914.1 DUF4942 domain-containing protein [Cronobacter sakazakii]MCI0323042.1 DUF4942 domain-containing protein [Cronobacter sakazakii]PPY14258.1 DUF4942 domain-containing protein [Cronobacter sakazakii]PPY53440.1 DUF4942 domain-containing protein [Cronobacter sakazakii]PQY66186.1 DUF4942 domain-containing protein [Cronobacter sakazakii]
MSTAIDPEVICELASSSELIPSISIENILARAAYAMEVFADGMARLREAHQLMKDATDQKMYGYIEIARNGLAASNDDACLKRMKRQLDAGIWSRLMNETGMKTFMSHQQISEWEKQLDTENMPEANLDNIHASFRALHQNKGQIFEQGVTDLFKKLSWDYKSNCPCKIGKKIIVNSMVGSAYSKNCYYPTDEGRNKLNDLEKMMSILDGHNIPDHREAAGAKFYDFTRENMWNGKHFEHEYFTVRYFKGRTGHIIFKRLDLVDKLNDIISRQYGSVLASRV